MRFFFFNKKQKPPNNPHLNSLLQEGAKDGELDIQLVLEALKWAVLMAPVSELPDMRKKGLTPLKFRVIEVRGEKALFAFTNYSAYSQFVPALGDKWVPISGNELCRLAKEGNYRLIIINPAGPAGCCLGAEEINSLII